MAAEVIDRDEVRADVAAASDAVWELVADVTQIPRWSPVCRRCEWLPPADGPEVGARFVGHNQRGLFRWSRECEITACEPGRQLSFVTFFKGDQSTRWDYTFTPSAIGTEVVERYEAVLMPRWVRFLRRLPGALTKTRRDAHANISESISRLKAGAEAGAGLAG